MRSVWILFFGAVALWMTPSGNAHADVPVRLFPFEAPIEAGEEPGHRRLLLPAEVLRQARPDLSDVRIFDSADHEVPTFVDSGARPLSTNRPSHFDATITHVERETTRPPDSVPFFTETFVIQVPAVEPGSGSWDLVFATPMATFVRRVELSIIADPPSDGSILRTSIFRLENPGRERLRIPLPRFRAAAVTQIRVVLSGEGSYVEPAMQFESAERRIDALELSLVFEEISRSSEDGVTRVILARPVGVVPGELRVSTDTPDFFRTIRAYDDGPMGRTLLRTATIYSASMVPELVAGAGGALTLEDLQSLSFAVSAARGSRLVIEIEDGDSPPLSALRVEGVVVQPALVFDLRGRGTLRFGGGRVAPPRYDLERLYRHVYEQTGAVAASTEARLGGIRNNPTFDRTPALAFAMHAGERIDDRSFAHRRELTLPTSAEGLSRLRLHAEDIARARDDLGDLRVLDAQSMQWPYLLRDNGETELIPLTVEQITKIDGRSRYVLRAQLPSLVLEGLTLELEAPYIDRGYELRVRSPGGTERTIQEGRFERRPTEEGPSLELAFERVRAEGVILLVEDGDDAPLVFDEIAAVSPIADLYIAAPAGQYALVLGNAQATAPVYEIARAEDLVLSVTPGDASAGAMAANPHFAPPMRTERYQLIALWGTLIVAVLLLGFLTFRMARTRPAEVKATEQPPSTEAAPPPDAGPSAG